MSSLPCRKIKINSFLNIFDSRNQKYKGLASINQNLILSSIVGSNNNMYRYNNKLAYSLLKIYSSINYKEDSIVTELKDTFLLTIQKLFLQDIKYKVDCPKSKLDCLLYLEESNKNLFSAFLVIFFYCFAFSKEV